MNIVIRTDASIKIGTGHVMRCLTLADQLQKEGARVFFVCQEVAGHLCDYIEDRGYSIFRLSDVTQELDQTSDAMQTAEVINNNIGKADVVIVDHYHLDFVWERYIKQSVGRIIVIDDLANRQHVCDYLLDQNYFKDFENRYNDLVPSSCKKFLGPQYLLLRPEFIEARRKLQKRDGKVEKLLIFYGGSDPTNETVKVLSALKEIEHSRMHVDVVVGATNPERERVKQLCYEMKVDYHCQIDYLALLMAKADLSLGAGGVTMWERCFLGLPSITTIVAENQKASTVAAGKFGAVWNIGWHEDVKTDDYVDKIREAFQAPALLTCIGKRAMELMQSENVITTSNLVREILK